MSEIEPHQLAALIKQRARLLGFDLCGITSAGPSEHRDYFRQWLESGQAGEMQYLHARFDERTDPRIYFPTARSIVCVAMNYHAPLDASASDPDRARGRIARYALGDDYHEHVKRKLHELADWLRATAPGVQTRSAVDTAPVMEKELSARAGIGWIGKHTCVIHARLGSWLLLGEILTSLELPFDEPAVDRCGSCTRCLDACPTGAITAPYQLEARKCISYLTIEHRGEIEPALAPKIGDWLFGCDICQEVCPHNSRPLDAIDPALRPRFADGTLDANEVLDWTATVYNQNLRRSAMKRVKLPVLKRNAKIVAANARR